MLISVIIPTFNRVNLLKKCLDAILSQSFRSFEVLVIDNCSNDGTEDYVRSHKDQRIRYFKNQNNGIIAVNRNVGIKNAKGDYIGFCDDDDVWYQNKLERIEAYLKTHLDADLLYHDEIHIGKNGRRKVFRYGPVEEPVYEDLLFNGNRPSTSATVVKREILVKNGGFCEKADLVTAEDYDLWLRIAKEGGRFAYLREVLGEYVRNEFAMTSKIELHYGNIFNVIERHIELMRNEGTYGGSFLANKSRELKADNLYSIGREYYANGNIGSARKFYIESTNYSGLWWKPYVAYVQTLLPKMVNK